MRRITLLSSLAILVGAGCDSRTWIERSDIKTETAVVQGLVYTPPTHGRAGGGGIGFSTDGNLIFGSGGGDVSIGAVWGVVFRCEHGNFVVQGGEPKHEELWRSMREGATVLVRYRELYRCHRQAPPAPVGFDFLDARIVGDCLPAEEMEGVLRRMRSPGGEGGGA